MSKNKTRPLNMLIIDDNKEHVESLNRRAQGHRIMLKHFCNLDEGKKFLESKEGRSICGVILDVICMKNKEQKFPDKSFITAALKYFNQKLPNIPIVVLTGVTDEYKSLKDHYDGTETVYSKGRDESAMLLFLRDKALELERVKLLNKYSEVFEIIEDHFDDDAEEELISCLLNTNSSDFHTMKGTLSCLRILQEKMFVALNKYDDQMVPEEYVSNEENNQIRVNFASILHYLKGKYDNTSRSHLGKKYILHDSTIDRFMQFVYKTSSEGIHAIDENISNKPTKYTVQAVTYALLDLLLWFKTVCDGKTM